MPLKAWKQSRPAVFEDESSGSLWMQIRLQLKKFLPSNQSNWLMGTSFRSYNVHEGKLTVATADETISKWCGEDFAGAIFEIIREQGLPIKEVVYKPARITGGDR